MKNIIQEKLREIERERNVRVLFACESGSRAWGFPSPDSDWDVRFIYVEQPDWYVTVVPRRDVIEMPINDALDISGWELRKALNLMRKSNPPLLEWLDSNIVYQQDETFIAGIRELVPLYFSPKSCAYHYWHMARNNYREFMKGDEVKLKKYLYILRPVLGCIWLENRSDPVPMRFEIMVEKLLDDGPLKDNIRQLVALKKNTPELGKGPSIPSINTFIEKQMVHMESVVTELETASRSTQPADEFLRATIRRVWNLNNNLTNLNKS